MTGIFIGIEHVAIASRDPEGLAAWYCRCMEFEIHTRFDNGPRKPRTCMVRLGKEGPLIEIFPARDEGKRAERDNADPGLAHVAILVADFDRALALLNECGAQREGAERAAPGGARAQFFRDPERNLFHILYRPRALVSPKSKV